MTIDRKEFLNVLKQAMPGVENGNVLLEGADTFIFDNGFVHTYNDNISVSIPFPITNKAGDNISGALKAKEFYDLINRYKGETIKLIPKEGVWIIKSENAVAELTLLENNIIDRIKNIKPAKIKWHNIPEKFIEGISICQFSANKSVLSGIYINEGIITSTDEIRINWFVLTDNFTESFWISDAAASELIKIKNLTKYFISESWVHFTNDDNIIFSCKRLSQEGYPFDKIKILIESHMKTKEDITNELPKDLMEAVNRAAALSQNIESFDTIKLTFTNDFIEVFSQRPSGKYTEQVPWEKAFKKSINPISIFVDYAMIENGISYSKSFYLKKTMKKDKEIVRIIFANPNGMQLITTFDGSDK